MDGLLFLVLHNYIRGMNATFCILSAHVTLTIVLWISNFIPITFWTTELGLWPHCSSRIHLIFKSGQWKRRTDIILKWICLICIINKSVWCPLPMAYWRRWGRQCQDSSDKTWLILIQHFKTRQKTYYFRHNIHPWRLRRGSIILSVMRCADWPLCQHAMPTGLANTFSPCISHV